MIAIALIVLSTLGAVDAAPDNNEAVQQTPTEETVEVEQPKEQERVETPKPDSQQVTWRDNPNDCTDKQWIAKEAPFKCIDKPAQTSRGVASSAGSGSCEAEIAKYNWNQSVARAVMLAESGGNPGIVNNNPRTGDYSVGCFQINLYGNLRNTRPSEAWLKNAANNVSYAYKLYQSSGWTPWGATTCRYKVSCY